MKTKFLLLVLVAFGFFSSAQKEFHVFPNNHKINPGKSYGDGSINNPWDLQTALSQKSAVINGGDVVWIHQGIYAGRFVSHMESTIENKEILVSGYKDDHVVLDGNVDSEREPVLEIRGGHVTYQKFEVAWLGDYSRNEADIDFRISVGVRHLKGENVNFFNLKIHDIPGLGFGFWKHGAGSVIENCMIYNNGYVAKNGKGRGEGIYVQNKSDQMRWIKNNIIFNNYYKGIEVWSAGKSANYEYVKNITLQGNIIFNNANPAGRHYDNLIVASADRNGINVAKNIRLLDNVLYHNLDVNGKRLFDGPSLTLGFNKTAPITDVLVENNIILGRSDGLRILHANKLNFRNNLVHTGFVHMSNENPKYIDHWKFDNNRYFTKNPTPFRMINYKNNSKEDWQKNYGLDTNSEFFNSKDLSLPKVLQMHQSEQDSKKFQLALFEKDGNDVEMNFSKYGIKAGAAYHIYDAENPSKILASGKVSKTNSIVFPMDNNEFQRPLHNYKAVKTPSSFGVFLLEFDEDVQKSESKGVIGKIKERFGF